LGSRSLTRRPTSACRRAYRCRSPLPPPLPLLLLLSLLLLLLLLRPLLRLLLPNTGS
jgi:hypothetical protein